MRIVIFGGTGQLGTFLTRWLRQQGHTVDVIGRSVEAPNLRWDGMNDGPWMASVDGADAVINLAGRSVNCRYNWPNLNEMMQSRLDSCEAVGRAIERAETPPPVWIQASTATIYAHSLDQVFDEENGIMGGKEDNVPAYWAYSVAIARAWEFALLAAKTPHTRKVALRTGFTMSPDKGGVFDVLAGLAKVGLGGPLAGGKQYISWITDEDFVRAILHCIEDTRLTGPVNFTTPEPITNRDFMGQLARDTGQRISFPIPKWMAWIGTIGLKTDIELMLKSRRVIPSKLLDTGFQFMHPSWPTACPKLVARWKEGRLLGNESRQSE
jgi:uncharacterized protein (TIGR01777 family)